MKNEPEVFSSSLTLTDSDILPIYSDNEIIELKKRVTNGLVGKYVYYENKRTRASVSQAKMYITCLLLATILIVITLVANTIKRTDNNIEVISDEIEQIEIQWTNSNNAISENQKQISEQQAAISEEVSQIDNRLSEIESLLIAENVNKISLSSDAIIIRLTDKLTYRRNLDADDVFYGSLYDERGCVWGPIPESLIYDFQATSIVTIPHSAKVLFTPDSLGFIHKDQSGYSKYVKNNPEFDGMLCKDPEGNFYIPYNELLIQVSQEAIIQLSIYSTTKGD